MTFDYDATRQLLSASESGSLTHSYLYDPAGNRTTKSESGYTTNYNPANNVNQITLSSGMESTSSVYDNNGNLTSSYYNLDDSQRIMLWDSINRLIAIEVLSPSGPNVGDKRVEFTYDALGQCATRNVRTWTSSSQWSAGTQDYYRWDQGRVVQIRTGGTGSHQSINYYPQGERHSYYGTNNNDYFYTLDHLGSVYELMTMNGGSAMIQAAFDYTPFGERTLRSGSATTSVGWAGHLVLQPSAAANQASGQILLSPRLQYDPRTGRWLSSESSPNSGNGKFYGNGAIANGVDIRPFDTQHSLDPNGYEPLLGNFDLTGSGNKTDCLEKCLEWCEAQGNPNIGKCVGVCQADCEAGKPPWPLPAPPMTPPKDGFVARAKGLWEWIKRIF